jgi:hypothetical protein
MHTVDAATPSACTGGIIVIAVAHASAAKSNRLGIPDPLLVAAHLLVVDEEVPPDRCSRYRRTPLLTNSVNDRDRRGRHRVRSR